MKLILIIFAISLLSCKSSKSETKPLVMEDTIKFGSINWTDTLQINHEIKNLNDFDVKIEKVSSSCDCINAKILDSTIKSGNSSKIQLTYSPQSFNDSGYVVKFVPIRTSLNNEIKMIYLAGNVIK